MARNDLHEVQQSVYRQFHSTETVLRHTQILKVVRDLCPTSSAENRLVLFLFFQKKIPFLSNASISDVDEKSAFWGHILQQNRTRFILKIPTTSARHILHTHINFLMLGTFVYLLCGILTRIISSKSAMFLQPLTRLMQFLVKLENFNHIKTCMNK